ncbi:unnamed protein product [Paramecium sonneborni]|uniref:Protein kinase domain-containing protein n=1 Tax=Paramecium sonneborni TaxID=65129 RepID=A0A8S1QZ04_9CILI|nr:unnamed protein product [Paramecium sonneborni]
MEFLNYKKRRVFKKFILMGNLNKTTSSTQASYKIKLRKNKQRQLFFQTEKRIIQMIVNNKVISLIDHIEIKDKHYQVMEHYIGGDLDFYIELLLQERNMQSLSGYQGKEFLKQLLNGFKGLQDIFMIHHDLKLKIFCQMRALLELQIQVFSKLVKLEQPRLIHLTQKHLIY